jgi:hypothetical protein
MDKYLEIYVDNAIDNLEYRNGIRFLPGWMNKFFSSIRRS